MYRRVVRAQTPGHLAVGVLSKSICANSKINNDSGSDQCVVGLLGCNGISDGREYGLPTSIFTYDIRRVSKEIKAASSPPRADLKKKCHLKINTRSAAGAQWRRGPARDILRPQSFHTHLPKIFGTGSFLLRYAV
ncbi:hypothetical protein EVAR_70775_1 [Eumeta japonica]|uniref:Uncharacterized protein n=1 Tax=Eumeta variegata TaxID=151549 RepID=A0A4C1SAX0_EUMVA|nr:hypothetical protein EVAR_70775_1 [Eumeta japonica]